MYNSQLTTFVQVADSGSFNKAAEALYISSTAVIKQINALEKHLDLTLFSRTNHGHCPDRVRADHLQAREKAVCLFGKSDCGGPSGRGRGGHNLLRGDVHPQPLQTIYGPLVPGQ